MSRTRPGVLAILSLGFVFALTASSALSDAFDPRSASKQPIISSLANLLDVAGIDVLYDFSSPRAMEVPRRPRLAPLTNFPFEKHDEVDRLILEDRDFDNWVDAYRTAGHHALLAAGKNDAGVGQEVGTLKEFRKYWDDARPNKRVFISYTSANQDQADEVKTALMKKGFVVFTFKDVMGTTTLTTLAETSKFFREATHRLVIDSEQARKSIGVQIESKYDAVVRQYLREPDKTRDVTERTFNKTEFEKFRPEGGPGGILLGVKMSGAGDLKGAALRFDKRRKGIVLVAPDSTELLMPESDLSILRECLDFAKLKRAGGSVVTIDVSRQVTLAEGLTDTNIGNRIIKADMAPFDIFDVVGAARSRIIDQKVELRRLAGGKRVGFDVELNLYFLTEADGSARKLVSLTQGSKDQAAGFELDPKLREIRPEAEISSRALKQLARRLKPLAECAAWISFFQWAKSNKITGLDDVAAALRRETEANPPVTTPRRADHDDGGARELIKIGEKDPRD